MALTTAIVLNWRRPGDTIACVESLIRLERDLDVIVVDNHSPDGSMAAIATGLERSVAATHGRYEFQRLSAPDAVVTRTEGAGVVALVDSGRNGGYAFGNNVGLRLALQNPACRYFWVLNNDTVVPEGASLDGLIAKMQANPRLGLCGSTVAYSGKMTMVQARGGGSFDPRRGECHQIGAGEPVSDPVDEAAIEARMAYVNGAAALVSRAFLEDVGLMTEDYFLYFEEIDWAMRAKGRFDLGYCASSLIYHEVGASIGTDDFGSRSPMSAYYLARNRLKFLWRHARGSWPTAAVDVVRDMISQWRKGRPALAAAIGRGLLGIDFKNLV